MWFIKLKGRHFQDSKPPATIWTTPTQPNLYLNFLIPTHILMNKNAQQSSRAHISSSTCSWSSFRWQPYPFSFFSWPSSINHFHLESSVTPPRPITTLTIHSPSTCSIPSPSHVPHQARSPQKSLRSAFIPKTIRLFPSCRRHSPVRPQSKFVDPNAWPTGHWDFFSR